MALRIRVMKEDFPWVAKASILELEYTHIFTGVLSMHSYGIARRSIGCFVGSTISFTSIYATGTTGAIQMSTGT